MSSRRPRLALVGDQYNHAEPAHPRIEALLPALGFDIQWVPTTRIDEHTDFTGFDGIWVVPGAPYHAYRGVNRSIRFARENKTPLFGTCGGFYHSVLEYAQNVLDLPETRQLENDLKPIEHLVIPPACAVDNNNWVPTTLQPGSRMHSIYGRTDVLEILQCDWGMDKAFLDAAGSGEVHFVAWDGKGQPRALEIDDHPFFLACLFQPELTSTIDEVHPVVAAFLEAVRQRAGVAELRPVPGDIAAFAHALDAVRADAASAPAFADGCTFEQVEMGEGLRAVARYSADRSVRLLCVHNVSAEPQEYQATELAPGQVVWLGRSPGDTASQPADAKIIATAVN
ncbi:hypothetical protein D5S17_14930 [Pseudonocardiaceae bacterium YIM PH 21723]|nr:hypothetical protein D5S17_14930 [Pseudonocardiaceae bacterium YIM PH 21723]